MFLSVAMIFLFKNPKFPQNSVSTDLFYLLLNFVPLLAFKRVYFIGSMPCEQIPLE